MKDVLAPTGNNKMYSKQEVEFNANNEGYDLLRKKILKFIDFGHWTIK